MFYNSLLTSSISVQRPWRGMRRCIPPTLLSSLLKWILALKWCIHDKTLISLRKTDFYMIISLSKREKNQCAKHFAVVWQFREMSDVTFRGRPCSHWQQGRESADYEKEAVIKNYNKSFLENIYSNRSASLCRFFHTGAMYEMTCHGFLQVSFSSLQ